MFSRRVVPFHSSGTGTSRIPTQVAPLTPLFATLTSQLQLSDSLDFEALYFDILAQLLRVSPLFITLAKNTRGGGILRALFIAPPRYLLTPFHPSTYTHFSVSSEEPCI